MVESDLNARKVAHEEGFGFHRDPSFSNWGQNSIRDREIVNTSEDDDNFELPVLQKIDEQQGSGNVDMFPAPSTRRGNQNGNYASFDIENADNRKLDHEDTNFVERYIAVSSSSRNPIAVSDLLKTLFFILMWYIFSTLLTLYNKTLLGDDMGRFPAPLLMNTVHFAMQAILSRGITYFWSHRFEPAVSMSRKDYFVRDGLCLSQLYQHHLQQHWIST